MRPQEAGALLRYLGSAAAEGSESVNCDWCPKVTRWARLRLPNGQVARCRWKESLKPLGKLRTARNVKFIADNGIARFGEVLYYFRCKRQNTVISLAVLSAYSQPDPELLAASHGTFISCKYLGDNSLQVIDVSRIQSVVAMVPHKLEKHRVEEKYYFLVERPGPGSLLDTVEQLKDWNENTGTQAATVFGMQQAMQNRSRKPCMEFNWPPPWTSF
ncbi:hypothetical protein BDZ97DRAFT_1763202 [Flammula alnicola]|nr:hypothetical protein BDZ97DRAFT_1763202 [Flammula alnicola]